jgi:hypothetical protein
MKKEPILQMRIDNMILTYTCNKSLTVSYPERCEWKDGLKIDKRGGLIWYTDSIQQAKALELGCTAVAQGGNLVSVLGSTTQYSR